MCGLHPRREALLGHILQDPIDKDTTTGTPSSFLRSKFKDVELTTQLLNSYLSVFYKHALLETSRERFWNLFEDVGLSRSPRAYLEALERYANS